jgi:hypothetical protein
MWNYIFYEHRQADPQYQGILLWDLDNKEKRGFALYFCRLDTLRAGIWQPRSIFLKPVYFISE